MDALTPRICLTLRCNRHCWYCSVGDDVRWSESQERPGDWWIKRIHNLPGDMAVLTGGEPTLHRDFGQIVRGCTRRLSVYTNLEEMPDVPEGLNVHWRASCHSRTAEGGKAWQERVEKLRELGYSVVTTTVYCPSDVLAVLPGVVVDRPQRPPTPMAGPVRCTLERLLLGPDGRRWHCVSKMARQDDSGVVADDAAAIVVCEDARRCVPCDSLAAVRVQA